MATSICTQASTLTSTILTSVSASVINTVAAARSSSEAVEAAAVAAAEEAINANATHSVRNENLSSCYSFSEKKVPDDIWPLQIRLGFCVSCFLSILSVFLSQEKLRQTEKPNTFAKLQFLNVKIDQNANFAKLLTLFCVIFSCERKSERIKRT